MIRRKLIMPFASPVMPGFCTEPSGRRPSTSMRIFPEASAMMPSTVHHLRRVLVHRCDMALLDGAAGHRKQAVVDEVLGTGIEQKIVRRMGVQIFKRNDQLLPIASCKSHL